MQVRSPPFPGRIIRLYPLPVLTLALLVAHTVASSGPDPESTASATAQDASLNILDANVSPEQWPPWLKAWSYDGGAILTPSTCSGQASPPAWCVPADAPEGVGLLYVVLDRDVLTNDLSMELALWDYTQSSLYLDLLTTNVRNPDVPQSCRSLYLSYPAES
jgi:hypothetical protein